MHQETRQLICRYEEGRKILDDPFRDEMPAALRESGLAAKKDMKFLADWKDALNNQMQK